MKIECSIHKLMNVRYFYPLPSSRPETGTCARHSEHCQSHLHPAPSLEVGAGRHTNSGKCYRCQGSQYGSLFFPEGLSELNVHQKGKYVRKFQMKNTWNASRFQDPHGLLGSDQIVWGGTQGKTEQQYPLTAGASEELLKDLLQCYEVKLAKWLVWATT